MKFLNADGPKVRGELVHLQDKMVLASPASCRSQSHHQFLEHVAMNRCIRVQALLFI
ncbi:hypothetical protein ACE6H2_028623 [Prunus campanulata]